MRDNVILGGMSQLEQKVGKDITALHDLNLLCRSRIDAFEQIFLGSRFSLLKAVILSLINPKKLQELLDQKHQDCLDEYAKRSAKMAESIMKQSRLTIVGNGHA